MASGFDPAVVFLARVEGFVSHLVKGAALLGLEGLLNFGM
jgi:hypothetical protein